MRALATFLSTSVYSSCDLLHVGVQENNNFPGAIEVSFAVAAMAPSFLPNFKELRRRSRASFKTDRSTDTSSDGSNGATPTSGSLTPPSIAYQSDPALNDQLKDSSSSPSIPIRPPLQPPTNVGSNRYSVSGMTGLGSPVSSGRGPQLPISQYSPHIDNIADNAWVS